MINKTEAIIIRTRPFRSSSLIVTFFTKEYGKMQAIAKGVHKEGERRGAEFELFNHVEVIYYEKKRSDLHLVSEMSLLDNHFEVRKDFHRIAYASYFCDLVGELTEIYDPHPFIYELMSIAFRYLGLMSYRRITSLFEFKILEEIGWIPYMDHCLGCGKEGIESGYLSISDGMILCDTCRMKDQKAVEINADLYKVMKYLKNHDVSDCIKYQYPEKYEIELKNLLSHYLMYRLGKPLKSWRFLKAMYSDKSPLIS